MAPHIIKVDVLAKRVADLIKEREEARTRLLEEHSASLIQLHDTLMLLVERTKDLPDVTKRVTELEAWRICLPGIVSTVAFVGILLGWVLGFAFKR